MIKKHIILIGITIALILLFIAASKYPGGSQADLNSIGYDMKNNYLCNLFNSKAMNGDENDSRIWAITGMFFMCFSMAVFFIRISAKITSGNSSKVIKYSGVASMVFAFFVVTSLHDLMTILSSTCALLALFYITVFIFRSKLFLFKLWSVFCMVILYFTNYIYYSGYLIVILPIMQKVSFLFLLIWILGLEYFTQKSDFQPMIKSR